MMDILVAYLPFLIPLLVVQLGAQAWSIVHLFRQDTRVRGGNKVIWAIVILGFQLLGVLAYQLFGRLPASEDEP